MLQVIIMGYQWHINGIIAIMGSNGIIIIDEGDMGVSRNGVPQELDGL